MAEPAEVEICVIVDSEGQSSCGDDAEKAREHYEDEYGALNEAEGFRLLYLKVTVPLPAIVELTGTAPAQGEASLTIK